MSGLRFQLLFLSFIFILSGSQLSADDKSKPLPAEIIRSVQQELNYHPQARLKDLYKFFFQGAFGPGHLIADADQALRYLEAELAATTEYDSLLWQPVGAQNQFYRLNLKLIKDGRIPLQAFCTAFIASGKATTGPELETWKRTWQFILQVIQGMQLSLPDWEDDRAAIDSMLASGKVIGHHSEIYRKLYHPHYRLVDRVHFEQLLKIIK